MRNPLFEPTISLNRVLAGFLAVVAGLGLANEATGSTLTGPIERVVSSQANIFNSGRSNATIGLLPTEIYIGHGVAGRKVIFPNVTGIVSCCLDLNSEGNGPDGGPYASGTTDILSSNNISGVIFGRGDRSFPALPYVPGRTMFLTGVFLGEQEPTTPAPSRLDFTDAPYGVGPGFLELSPKLQQTFFIGDGRTGTRTGSLQTFKVPNGATRLFLGFADALEFGFPSSAPDCCYQDNVGELSVTTTVVPLPGTLPLAVAALASLGLARRARRSGTVLPRQD